MSSTEFHKGKAKKIEFDGDLTLQEKVDALKERGIEFEYFDVYDDYVDISSKQVIYLNGDFYELSDYFWAYDSDQDISQVHVNEDGTIDFMFQFYNGGTCLKEMFGNALKEKK